VAREADQYHTVSKGDTLYSIAFRNGSDYRDVAAWNNISAPYTIYVGQKIKLYGPAITAEDRPARDGIVAGPSAKREGQSGSQATPEIITRPVLRPLGPVAAQKKARSAGVGKFPAATKEVRTPVVERRKAVAVVEKKPAEAQKAPPAGAGKTLAETKTTTSPGAEQRISVPVEETRGAEMQTTPSAEAGKAHATTRTTAPPGVEKRTPLPVEEAGTAETRPPVADRNELIFADKWEWPLHGRIVKTYSESGSKGIDIVGDDGQSVVAAAPGKVVYSGQGLIGYGNLIIIKHSDIYLSAYGNNKRLFVAEGEFVKAGKPIAEIGKISRATPTLHFEIRKEGKPVNPIQYLPTR